MTIGWVTFQTVTNYLENRPTFPTIGTCLETLTLEIGNGVQTHLSGVGLTIHPGPNGASDCVLHCLNIKVAY